MSSFSGPIIFLVSQNYCVISQIFKVGLEKQRGCRRCTEAQTQLEGCEDRAAEAASRLCKDTGAGRNLRKEVDRTPCTEESKRRDAWNVIPVSNSLKTTVSARPWTRTSVEMDYFEMNGLGQCVTEPQ